MPEFRNRIAVDITKGLGLFMDIRGGIFRGEVTDANDKLHAELEEAKREIEHLKSRPGGIVEDGNATFKPGNIVWTFGTGRGGSTWLMNMMCEMPAAAPWN